MQQSAVMLGRKMRQASRPGDVPWPVRFAGKLVLEVLPAALASVIGAFLFAHYQFARPADPQPAAADAPASAQMLQLVRDEHAMIRAFLVAQQAAEQNRAAAADAADARAAADARLAAAAVHRLAAAMAQAKPSAPRGKPLAVATVAAAAAASPAPVGAAPAGVAGAALLPVVVADVAQNAEQNADLAPATAPAPVRASLVERTLAVKDHVVTATLHAVMAIGGIPSWIGHRLGADNLDSGGPPSSAAS